MRSAPLFLALRYLRPKRSFVSVITLISVLGVMLGVGVLVVVMSVFKGWQVEFKKMVLGFEPHILVMQEAPVQGPIDPNAPPMARSGWREVLEMVRAQPEVESAQPIARGGVVAELGKKAQGLEILGLQSGDDNALIGKLRKHLKSGVFDLDGNHIILPEKQAESLGAKLGDLLLVNASESLSRLVNEVRLNQNEPDETKRAQALDGVIPTGTELTLVGILRSDTAGSRGYVAMNIGQELFMLDDGVSGIEVELRDPDLAHRVATDLMDSEKLPWDWTPSTWTQEHGFMLQNVESQQSLMWFLLLFIMIVAATCVMNTTITVTVQKRREIGILTALGSRAGQVMGIFLSQAAIVAVLGCVLGMISGFTVLHYRNDLRAWLAETTGKDFFPSDIYFLSSIPSYTHWTDLASICGVAVVLCLLAALIPSYFAARVDPAVALRD
jgi:lipoprotein-releasing system permease protein